jgi:hypothetical protein
LEKIIVISSGYEFYQKVIVTSLIIAKSYNTYYLIRHSVIYTLTLIESYLNIVLKDNNESEAVTMRNQFGRLKSSLEFTDYYHLTNQQLEELLKILRCK